MNVSAWAVRSPVPSIVLFMVLMALGLFTFAEMPVKRFPNVDIPVIQVQITQPGASPAELETQVTKEVEDAVAGVTGIKHIVSNVVEGASTTTLEFELGVPIDRATSDVKNAIDQIRADLPNSIEEPIVQRIDIAGLPILIYGVTAPAMTPEELSWLVDDTIVHAIQSISGVAQVTRIGGVTREIRVALDPDKLIALGITAGEVNRQLRATNIDIAGGRAEMAGQRQAIRTLASQTSVKALEATRIALSDGRHIRLGDIATELFMASCVYSRLTSLMTNGTIEEPVKLKEFRTGTLYLRMARRRNRQRFDDLKGNFDEETIAVAKDWLNHDFES